MYDAKEKMLLVFQPNRPIYSAGRLLSDMGVSCGWWDRTSQRFAVAEIALAPQVAGRRETCLGKESCMRKKGSKVTESPPTPPQIFT